MVNTGEMEQYLNDKSAKEGDVVEITGEGEIVEREYNGKKQKLLNLPVLLNGDLELTWTPGKAARMALVAAWGADTVGWKGRKFTVKFNSMIVKGEERNVIKPLPIN